MDLKGKQVLVLGVGASGLAAASLLVRRGAAVRCSDSGRPEDLVKNAALLRDLGCRVETGGHTEDFARGVELAVISPGIDPSVPLVKRLAGAGIPVIAELELAFAFCTAAVVAVTGTNGKTTTVTLLERVLRDAGRDAIACGNIGRPFSELVEGAQPEIAVIEVSSFQLEGIRDFRPRVGVMLNIADDHLDRYAGMAEYVRAKAALFRNQRGGDWAVVRSEDRALWEREGALGAQSVSLFSACAPLAEGACVEDETLVLKRAGARETICRGDELLLAGAHNVENALAVAAAASLCGVAADSMGRTIRGFRGLPHRMELVGEREGVRYINDSKATNPDAVLKALRATDSPVILIAGGRDKGFDYAVLRDEVRRRVRMLILIGEARTEMARALQGAAETAMAGDLGGAVRLAAARAAPGDTVLLSPACSSYDMFVNYEERGDVFKRCVENIMQLGRHRATGSQKPRSCHINERRK